MVVAGKGISLLSETVGKLVDVIETSILVGCMALLASRDQHTHQAEDKRGTNMRMTLHKTTLSTATVAVLALLTAACGGGGGGGDANGVGQSPSASAPAAGQSNSAEPATLQLTGAPPAEVTEGEFYFFQPAISGAGSATVRFSVINKPDWAEFDPDGGILYGTPGASDVGTAVEVTIAANDLFSVDFLPPFTISVNPSPDRQSLTLSWLPPTENEDGSTLTDLAGYRIY